MPIQEQFARVIDYMMNQKGLVRSQFYNYNGLIKAVLYHQLNQKFFLHSAKGNGGNISF